MCVGDYLVRILCLKRKRTIHSTSKKNIFKLKKARDTNNFITLPLQAHKVINMIMINGFEKYNKWMLTYFFEIGDTKIGKWHVVFVVFLALLL